MGNGRLTYLRVGRKHFHAQPIFWVTADVTFYPTLVFYKVSPNQGIIAAMGCFVEELLT